MLKLNRVTITGADDNTLPEDLIKIHQDFPFVEFAILFSINKIGQPRYPTTNWLRAFHSKILQHKQKVNLSAHLCGRYVKNILEMKLDSGSFDFRTLMVKENMWHLWDRIQLNIGGRGLSQEETEGIENTLFRLGMRSDRPSTEIQFILGGSDGKIATVKKLRAFIDESRKNSDKGENYKSISMKQVVPLFDGSGGRGIETKIWPMHFSPYSGFAGGLNPKNVVQNIKSITQQPAEGLFWIDVETGVRDSENKLDIGIVREFLLNCQPFISS